MTRGYKYSKRWFWGIIILGIFLPLIVESVVTIILDPKDFLNIFSSFFLSLILIGLLNDIPFIVFAFLVRSLWNRPEAEKFQDFFKHKTGVISAGIISIGSILYINIGVWISIMRVLPGSSTSVIVYAFLPIYGVIAILVGYGCGWFVGKIILRVKIEK